MSKSSHLFASVACLFILACDSSGSGIKGSNGTGNPGTGSVGNSGGTITTGSVPGLVADNPGGTWVVTPDTKPDTKPAKTPKGGTGTTTGTGTGTATGTDVTCAPGTVGLFVTDCGYPYASDNPLTNVSFNESEVLRAIRPSIDANGGVVSLLYNDEHAMTLGVRQVVVKGASGTTTKDYPVTPLSANPDRTLNPQTGTNDLTGDHSGLDPSLRPLWPVLYVTDVTQDSTSRAGDWQMGGRPINPNAVFGTWKSAVRTVDNSTSPPTVSVTPDADPAKNNWNLTLNDPAPTDVKNEGWGTEVRWGVVFQSGHAYRLQVIVHDGDQNKVGGDTGEACIVFCPGGTVTTPPITCTPPSQVCGVGMGKDGAYQGCPEGESCVNGCCATLTCPTNASACGPIGAHGETVGCPADYSCVSGCCLYSQIIY